jgi:acylphosphatase
MVRFHISILGRVQGVGYRAFVWTQAKKLGVVGKTWNAEDGTVGAIFEGPNSCVESLLDLCRQGPKLSRVDKIEVLSRESIQKMSFADFEISG